MWEADPSRAKTEENQRKSHKNPLRRQLAVNKLRNASFSFAKMDFRTIYGSLPRSCFLWLNRQAGSSRAQTAQNKFHFSEFYVIWAHLLRTLKLPEAFWPCLSFLEHMGHACFLKLFGHDDA